MRTRRQRGVIMILSYVVITFLLALTMAGFQRTTVELASSQQSVQTLQAFHNAEAGLDRGLDWLRTQPSPPSGTLAFNPPLTGPQTLGGGQYTVTIDPDDSNPTSYLDLYAITAIGQPTTAGIRRTVTGLYRTESFARFAYFTTSERLPDGTRIWFSSNDRLYGPVHSNDQLNIAGSPAFFGPVSSAAATINYRTPPPVGGNNPQFSGGLQLRAATMTLPTSVTALRVAASSGGAWYEGPTTITLQANGTMLVTNAARGWVNVSRPLPGNGAIFVNGGNAVVSGMLKGQVTIGTSANLMITNHLRYATDPVTTPQSTDLLGLLAEQNVIVSQSAPNDLTIQGSIMALQTSFSVENWWQGSPRGLLNLYGGVIQNTRGAVGSISGTTGQLLTGYAKNYQYDQRFSSLAPPFFPTTGRYEAVLWQEN